VHKVSYKQFLFNFGTAIENEFDTPQTGKYGYTSSHFDFIQSILYNFL